MHMFLRNCFPFFCLKMHTFFAEYFFICKELFMLLPAWLRRILILSNDIETNPGPKKSKKDMKISLQLQKLTSKRASLDDKNHSAIDVTKLIEKIVDKPKLNYSDSISTEVIDKMFPCHLTTNTHQIANAPISTSSVDSNIKYKSSSTSCEKLSEYRRNYEEIHITHSRTISCPTEIVCCQSS